MKSKWWNPMILITSMVKSHFLMTWLMTFMSDSGRSTLMVMVEVMLFDGLTWRIRWNLGMGKSRQDPHWSTVNQPFRCYKPSVFMVRAIKKSYAMVKNIVRSTFWWYTPTSLYLIISVLAVSDFNGNVS